MRRWSGWGTLIQPRPKAASAAAAAAGPDGADVDGTDAGPAAEGGAVAIAQAAEEAEGGPEADEETSADASEEHAAPQAPLDCTVPLALKEDPIRRAAVGRMCKRLIDLGRVEYLRSIGLEAELMHYCDAALSPENCLILAWPQGRRS